LATFDNGFGDVGCEERKSQKPADVSIAKTEPLRNCGRVGVFALSQGTHPRSCSRDGKDERLIDTLRIRSNATWDKNRLARARTGSRQRKLEGRRRSAVVVRVCRCRAGVPDSTFEYDLDLLVVDKDPTNEFLDDGAGFLTPNAGGGITRQIVSRQSASEGLDHKSLDILSGDTGEGTCSVSSVLHQRLTDVIPILVPSAHRIGRGHPVATVIEDETSQEGAALDLGAALLQNVI
jgi:hypothetical protein